MEKILLKNTHMIQIHLESVQIPMENARGLVILPTNIIMDTAQKVLSIAHLSTILIMTLKIYLSYLRKCIKKCMDLHLKIFSMKKL